jgi:dihydroflavonol-4-reductase
MIMVTGGTGLVGSHLVYQLLLKGKEVRVLVRSNSNKENIRKTFSYYSDAAEALFEQLDWAEGDVLDIYSLQKAMENVEQVYHCAAVISFQPGEEEWMMNTNVEGTANVVNACLTHGIKKLCHVSSVAALPESEKGSIVMEDTFWKSVPGSSHYALSKYASEREAWRGMEEGLDTVVVNPSIIIGPGEWKRSSSNMISASYKGIKFYTDGVAGFVDVRDVVKAMIYLMESKESNQRYIVSTENLSYGRFFGLTHRFLGKRQPYIKVGKSLSEIGWRLEKIRSGLRGKKSHITKETARASQQQNFYSNEKVRKVTGLQFIPVEKSVEDTCALFLKEHG